MPMRLATISTTLSAHVSGIGGRAATFHFLSIIPGQEIIRTAQSLDQKLSSTPHEQ
jgi:hypothetical protein